MARDALAIGRHAVKAALAAGRVRKIALATGTNRDLAAAAAKADVPLMTVSREKLRGLAGLDKNQGVAAWLLPPARQPAGWRELLAAGQEPSFVVLDEVADPRNLGACLRAAAFFGVAMLLHPQRRSASLSPAASKVASGAAATVPVVPVVNLSRELRAMRDAGVTVYGTVAPADAAVDVFAVPPPTGPWVLVMGSEDRGLRRLTRAGCDQLICVPAPASASVASLNVAVACGVCLAVLTRPAARK